MAFHTGAISRSQKRINLRDLQIRPQVKQQDEQIAGLVNWVKATGGKVIYTGKQQDG